ncbi:MAG: cytochrome c assembly protein [Verrucomicrobiales bacterium]|nr:cytochrome c assembly protein [Verrucomicrobiales bacterium]
MKKHLPWIITLVFALWIIGDSMPKVKKDTFDYNAFGKLPALLNGRVQPLDSIARNALLSMRGKQSAKVDEDASPTANTDYFKSVPPTEWLLEVLAKPEVADTRLVFRIDHPDLLTLLKLDAKRKYFSFNNLTNNFNEFKNQVEAIQQREQPEIERGNEKISEQRSPFEKGVMKLYQLWVQYQRLKNSLQREGTGDFPEMLASYKQVMGPGMVAVKAQREGQPYDTNAMNRVVLFVREFDQLSKYALPMLVPPANPAEKQGWHNTGLALKESIFDGNIPAPVEYYAEMAKAFGQDHVYEFNSALGGYNTWLQKDYSKFISKGKREFAFNNFQFFYRCMVIYLTAFVFACCFWFIWANWLQRTAYWLLCFGFVVHTVGLIYRMTLEGRPPVTNLYSSAIFIGWAAMGLCLILERFYKNGIGSVVGSFFSFLTLIIAHHLSLEGDTMEMLRAVLDTNFWLATHVVAVTLGYASTFVAGFLGIFFIIFGFFTRNLKAEMGKTLSKMVYGIICFATLFSFVGTILGGIWADQSWGRFWGWDPKENGALIIVIWNAAILHARWGGMVRERGMMNFAVFGNIVTSFSWFGVNMLGVGLHSYGFMDKAFFWLMFFVVSQLIIIGIGLFPLRFWASFAGMAGTEPTPKPISPGKSNLANP